MSEDKVTISKSEYEHLKERELLLDFLELLGVDNWSGYRTPPDREDYDSDEDWEEAWYEAANGGFW